MPRRVPAGPAENQMPHQQATQGDAPGIEIQIATCRCILIKAALMQSRKKLTRLEA